MVRLLGSAFGLGFLPFAPGTWGTLLGVGLAGQAALAPGPTPVLLAMLFAVTLVGTPLAGAAERQAGRTDPGWFVLDEVAGYLVALAWMPLSAWTLAGAFVFFRVFDIWKPWPIRRLERVPGGRGIMLDDLVAGFYANLLLRVVLYFA